MPLRKIIEIDEALCTGCGACITGCAEGALALVDGKAKVVSEVFCDGLGACIGTCPTGALTIVEREAPDFDERAVERHLAARKTAKEPEPLACGCPGSMARRLEPKAAKGEATVSGTVPVSALGQWPVQLRLVPDHGPLYAGRDLLILADCVAVADPALHRRLLPGHAIAMTCPKLDNAEQTIDKLARILANPIGRVRVAIMEVPCCGGLLRLVQLALAKAGVVREVEVWRLGAGGELLETYRLD